MLKDWRLPTKARGTMLAQTSEGVPLEISGELVFEDGTTAGMFCSFLVHETQLAVISGERASIQVGGRLRYWTWGACSMLMGGKSWVCQIG